jgi:2-dehydro-3-deoxygalactonokinase
VIAIDWGTTGFRAYRLDGAGAITARREAPSGILAVANQDFSGELDRQIGDWASEDDGPIVMSGMIGSRQGWREVPYVACPAGADALSAGLAPVTWHGRAVHIVPGLSHRHADGVPDVMRGEETQILGATEAIGPGRHLVCLPGTHSKWAEVVDGHITGFSTHMTGEAFAALRHHTILGRLMTSDEDDPAAFDAGLGRAASAGGLLHHLFGTRALGLFGEVPEAGLASYLSGLLIGHEVIAAGAEGTVHVLGAPRLAALYGRALTRRGVTVRPIDPDAVVRGLWQLAGAAGLGSR